MIAFASNSLLCRLALKHTTIDAATFTFARILSGAAALWLILKIQMRLRAERTALREAVVKLPSPPPSPKGRGGPFSLREKARMRAFRWKDAGNWWSALAL